MVLGFGFGLLAGVCAAGDRGLPTQQGSVNFGKVNESIYRGAQPDAAALKNLQRLGVKTIINLRMAGDCWKEEAAQAAANGLVSTNIPLHGLGRPTQEQVRTLLAVLEASPQPVFIHCQHGCDRTGTLVACYRIQHDKWSAKEALKEAELYGLSVLERGMRRFIQDFATANGKP